MNEKAILCNTCKHLKECPFRMEVIKVCQKGMDFFKKATKMDENDMCDYIHVHYGIEKEKVYLSKMFYKIYTGVVCNEGHVSDTNNKK